MTTLESDSSLRDDHLGDDGIEYNSYPTSLFVLTEAIDVGSIPADGESVSFTAIGELTVRNITNPATISLDATIIDGQLLVVGSTDISLDDYDASIGGTSEATMEFSILFSI